MNLPPFPLDWRNHDEQRTSPTNIPADAECGFRQRGLQEIYRKEKAAEKKATQVDSLRCCAACIGPAYAFARHLASEIRTYYDSEESQAAFEEWLKQREDTEDA